jgi:hypothetical protein
MVSTMIDWESGKPGTEGFLGHHFPAGFDSNEAKSLADLQRKLAT